MRPIHIALLLLGAALVAACTEPRNPTAVLGPAGPSFNFTNGPANAGPIVVRAAGVEILEFDNDPSRNLMTVMTPTSDNPFCGGSAPLDQVDRQRVFAPSAFIGHRTSDGIHVAVYATADFGELLDDDFPDHTTRFCSFISGPKKIAEGTARYSLLVHDAGTLQLVQRTEGFLNAVSGGTVHLKDVQVGVLKNGELVFVQEDILLQ